MGASIRINTVYQSDIYINQIFRIKTKDQFTHCGLCKRGGNRLLVCAHARHIMTINSLCGACAQFTQKVHKSEVNPQHAA